MNQEELSAFYKDELNDFQSYLIVEDGVIYLEKWGKPWKRISFKNEKEMTEYFIDDLQRHIDAIQRRIDEIRFVRDVH